MKRIELHAKTKYSMDHESTIDIKNLILKCIENNENGVAIVDTDSVVSFAKAEKILKGLNIKNFKLVYGVELKVSYHDTKYQVVVLLKNKKGVSKLFRLLSPYWINKSIPLTELIDNKKDFVIGLVYNQNNYDSEILPNFDYIEVDKNISRETIEELKKKIIVIYSNKINALSSEETLSKKILYDKLNLKTKIENRPYQNTEEVLKEINDKEIVIDNPNKIFNMIENFELIDDLIYLPNNNDFAIDLLVYINLNKKYGNNIHPNIIKRVREELKLIHEYNYDGIISIYKAITDKCKEAKEEYIICDYINYLYIAYILEITHFDSLKLNLNYDIFFSHHPNISIKLSKYFSKEILRYIKNDLHINTIRCKSLTRLNGINLERTFDNYENKNNIKFSLDEKVKISKYLDNYPINNNAITSKEIILPPDFNIYELTPREIININNTYNRYTNIDYKDIVDKFITIEIISNDNLTKLKELKDLTGNRIINCSYKDNNIITKEDFKNYLNIYDNNVILDDLYEDLINSDIELPEVFNIINEIRKEKTISKKTKDILIKNNLKLKKYHNITFISRGILNERVRLVYELLYFKEYYPLEYYYIILKDSPCNNLIEIIYKGYDEIINKLKDYNEYQYEYNYLSIVKELYNRGINFTIEEKIISEDFYFKLNKELSQIILVINKVNDQINKYLSSDISLVGTRPSNGKMPYLSKVIYKLLNEKQNITLFALGNSSTNYYLEYLLNTITGIERKSLRQYLNPCSNNINELLSLNEDKYLDGIKYLLTHNLTIKDYHSINDTIIYNANTLLEKVIYMINNINNEIIIIDSFESISNNIEFILKELKKISKQKNIKVIIFTNLKREWEVTEKNNLSSFGNCQLIDKYIDYISILDKEEIYIIKELSNK